MDKSMTKRNNYNMGILTILSEKYGYPYDYLRKCLRGDRVGEMPDRVKKDYKALEREAENLEKLNQEKLKEKANDLK